MYKIQALPRELRLGRQREQNVTVIVFDISAWLARWPGLVCTITHAKGGAPYPVTGIRQNGAALAWTVGADCTATSGYGAMVIFGEEEGVRVCSACVRTRVLAGHTAADPGDAPVPDAALERYEALPGPGPRWLGETVRVQDQSYKCVSSAENPPAYHWRREGGASE